MLLLLLGGRGRTFGVGGRGGDGEDEVLVPLGDARVLDHARLLPLLVHLRRPLPQQHALRARSLRSAFTLRVRPLSRGAAPTAGQRAGKRERMHKHGRAKADRERQPARQREREREKLGPAHARTGPWQPPTWCSSAGLRSRTRPGSPRHRP
eukprot:3467626-Rhodomonas_salina.1